MTGSSPRSRRALRLALGLLITLALTWYWRHSILVGVAALLVTEDPIVSADIIVVSNTMPQAAALEAALLHGQRAGTRIVMTDWVHDSLGERIRALGIPYSESTAALNRAILERSGVPSSAITVLPDRVDGTASEASAIAAFTERCRLTSVLVITARSHTARTKWLLERRLTDHVRVSVRSPRYDRFGVGAWWRERSQSREVIEEYLRWFNTLVLGDLWDASSVQDRPAGPSRRRQQSSNGEALSVKPAFCGSATETDHQDHHRWRH